ncbi:hypothetical protein V491_04156 [Pseudogymnoascus sp. VKM F-3775]|nr:hypothetical protein V491_04156 [Pseudogymnoascus sp. VKM F-3775]
MGCGSSQPSNEVELQPRPLKVSAPQGGLQMIPAPQRDLTGRPIRHQYYDLRREDLRQALQVVAEFLIRNHSQVTLVAVGGAVNTILLRTRDTTHDVDFFSSDLSHSDGALLQEAARVAQTQSTIPLGGDWLNNSTTLYMGRALQVELRDLAIQQNDIVFQSPGLTVLAAPWGYAFCTKVDRMTKRNARPYDCTDAAVYLNRFIATQNSGRPVNIRVIQARAAHFGTSAPIEQLQSVEMEYQRLYHSHGLEF